MFISLAGVTVPATTGEIDIDLIMAQVDTIVPSRTDVVAVSHWDGSGGGFVGKDAALLQTVIQNTVFVSVNGTERKMALWSFQMSQSDNYFIFYRIL